MKLDSNWLTSVAGWAAANEGPVAVQASLPSGIVRASRRELPVVQPSGSFVESNVAVLGWTGCYPAAEVLPGRIWEPQISGLPTTFELKRISEDGA